MTGDRALATVLKKWCEDHKITGTVIHCSESTTASCLAHLTASKAVLNSGLLYWRLRCLGSSFKAKRISSDTPITLIDTFVLNNGGADEGSIIKDGVYKDRYYPGLMEQLTEEEKSNLFYLPTSVGFNNPIKAFRLIRSASSSIL